MKTKADITKSFVTLNLLAFPPKYCLSVLTEVPMDMSLAESENSDRNDEWHPSNCDLESKFKGRQGVQLGLPCFTF